MPTSSILCLSCIVLLCFASGSSSSSSGKFFTHIPDRWSSQLPDRWSSNPQRAGKLTDRWSNDHQVADRWSPTAEIPDEEQVFEQLSSTNVPNQTPQGPSVPYNSDSSTATVSSTAQSQESAGRKVWCIGKPSAMDINLIRNLQYACGEGHVDCTQIQPGGSCYRPNSLIGHASYAMNLFYQKNGRNWWTCHFNNTGLLVFTDPSFGNCNYPAQ